MKKTLLLVFGGFVFVLLAFALFSYIATKRLHTNNLHLVNVDKTAELLQQHKETVLKFSTHSAIFDTIAKHSDFQLLQLQKFNMLLKARVRVLLKNNREMTGYITQNETLEAELFRTAAELGFKEYGVLGEMRKAIHEVENDYPKFEKEVLLMRRHEKDFIMRLDDTYAAKHKKIVDQLSQKLPENGDLMQYEKSFCEAQLLFHQIYSNDNSLMLQWESNIQNLQRGLRTERSRLLNKSSELSQSSLQLQLVLSSIVLLILVIVSAWCIQRFTRQVNVLQKSMTDFVESKYKNRHFDIRIPKNEIGQLMKRFLQLARKIEIEVRYLEERVDTRTKTLRHKNELLEYQHNEIVQSLNYAQNLQQSLLVSHRRVAEQFKEVCIHYSPKNLVGGDFYWMKTFRRGKSEMVLFALADCTGHGVPGALISVLGMNTLDEIFANGATNPATILNQLRLVISRRFNTENEQRLDGMDISIFLINKSTGKLTFAGAQMPLWIIRKSETIELKGQRTPIGLSYGKAEDFSNQVIQLESKDKILLFTDGLTDQFGDRNQKKWGKKSLRKCLYQMRESTAQQVFSNVLRDFEYWKQNQDQTDDCSFIIFEFDYQKEAKSLNNTLITLNSAPLKAFG